MLGQLRSLKVVLRLVIGISMGTVMLLPCCNQLALLVANGELQIDGGH